MASAPRCPRGMWALTDPVLPRACCRRAEAEGSAGVIPAACLHAAAPRARSRSRHLGGLAQKGWLSSSLVHAIFLHPS